MSNDEEMTDLSQVITQSGSVALTPQSNFSSDVSVADREPWARLILFKIIRKRLGNTNRVVNYQLQQIHMFGKKIQLICLRQ